MRFIVSAFPNHVVVVDFDRKMIFDSEKKYPASLLAVNLRWCSDNLSKSRIMENRPLVKVLFVLAKDTRF